MSRLGMFVTGLFILSAIACGAKKPAPERKDAPPPPKGEPKDARGTQAPGAPAQG